MYQEYLLSDICIESNQKNSKPLYIFILTDLTTSKIEAIDCIIDELTPISEVIKSLYRSSTVKFPHRLHIENQHRDHSLLEIMNTYRVQIYTTIDSKFYSEYRLLLNKYFSGITADTVCTISETLKVFVDEYNARQQITAI